MDGVIDRRMPSRRGLILLLGSLMALGPLSIDAYLPALPEIERSLRGGPGSAELTLSAYFAGLALAQLAWGPIADRYGRRVPIALGLATYVIGSIACAAAPSMTLLVAARALQGVGGSAGMVVVRAVVRDVWPSREAAQVLSRLMLVMGVAPVVAPLLGSAILAFSSWRMVFVLLLLAAVAMGAACWAMLPDTRGSTPASGAWWGTLSDPVFWCYTLAGGSASAGMFAYIASSPLVFQDDVHLSPVLFSLVFGVNAAALIACSQVNAAWVRRYDPVVIASWAAGGMVLAAAVALLVAHYAGPTVWIEAGLLVYVALLGFIGPNTTVAALEAQGARAGLASGVLGSAQFAMSAAGSALVGQIPASQGTSLGLVLVAAALWTAIWLAVGGRRR